MRILNKELPKDVDLVFIGTFTEAAQTAYALSNIFRSRGAVTVLGSPQVRCITTRTLISRPNCILSLKKFVPVTVRLPLSKPLTK